MSHTTLRTVVATRGDVGERLDLVLRRRLEGERGLTRTQVQVWIRGGAVMVNDRPVRRVAARMAVGDVIQVLVADDPPRVPLVMTPDAAAMSDVRVLYEDAFVLAVSKPAGMVVHPTYRHPTGTLLNGLLWHAREWPSPQRPSLVGRLDKLTSGLVLVARTRAIHASLQRALATSASRKEYLAIVYGRVTPARGTIDARLHLSDGDRRRVTASACRGLASVTRFERIAHVRAPRAGLALLRCGLITGRRHQIRAHLAARGWPIVGDPMYGEPRWSTVLDPALAATLAAFPRQALHAWRLMFPHPVTGAAVCLEAPLPGDLSALIQVAGLDHGLAREAAGECGAAIGPPQRSLSTRSSSD